MTNPETEQEIIAKLRAAEKTLLVIFQQEDEDSDASQHLQRAIDHLQEALLRIQLAG
jgi:hypothetical protein